ncbi:MAG: VOC family protein [Acidobacteriota bacterium]|nr:MAG: VOC family protein [Acidobacteriota bacterium]
MKEYSFFGEEAKFHHLGMAVESIRQICEDCDITVEETQKVSLAFIQFNGICLELIEPHGADSPILRNLQAGNKLLHLCYEVPDLEEAIERCRPAGFHRLGPPVTTPVFDGRRLAWVYSRQFGLFELVEMSRK